MIVLHGIWWHSALHLWGERTALADAPTRFAEGTAPARAVPHSAALASAELHAAAGELSADGLLASLACEASISLWLPAINAVPFPSAGGGAGWHGFTSASAIDLAPFTVPTLVFAPVEAIDLLESLPERQPRMCGDSIMFWSRLARYLVGLLARRNFVPDVEERDDGTCHACWRVAVTDEPELDWLRRIAETMPPACRAVVSSDERDADAAFIVETFLQSCADALIRRSLADDPFFHQIHERATRHSSSEVRWLSALIGDDRLASGPADQRVPFVNRLRVWVGRLERGHVDAPMKLCFVMDEPADDGDEDDAGENESSADAGRTAAEASGHVAAPRPWHVHFCVQPMDAGGELLDIANFWDERDTAATILRRRLPKHREHLIAELSRAAEVFPLLQDALRTESPSSVDLTAAEAHHFIRDCAPLLEARGFGVRLPPWATRQEQQLGLRLFVQPAEGQPDPLLAAAARMGLASLVDFEWRVAVGDEELSIEEFERLRAKQAPLVRLRGRWIHLNGESSRIAAEFLAGRRRGRMTLVQAIRAAGGAGAEETGLPIFGINASSWIDQLLRDVGQTPLERFQQPRDFRGILRPYQQRGLEWLVFMDRVGIGACLADDMGLGKTIQLIALLLEEKRRGNESGPTLIFAPMSVVGNWQREMERFGPSLKVFIHHGPERLGADAFLAAATRADAVITTYALGHRDLERLRRVPWHRIVLDEAQKIKNPSAAQTVAIRSLPSAHRIALTGTPLENHLSDLWSIMDMLNPSLLGSAADFRKRFAVPIERLGDRRRSEQLRGMIRPFVLRRVKSDPDVECDLPEKMEMRVYCNLTAEQAALYEQIVAAMLNEVDAATGIQRRGVILAALTRLKQVCNHPVHFLRDGSELDGRSGKCERLTEMLEEVVAEGDAALVFTQFREMGELLVRHLTERLHTEVLFLHGGTPAKRRQSMIDRFQEPDANVRIFLLSLKAGGLGLNLTAANHVFHFDRWWNPAVEQQATDRAYRIGQTRRVQVHKFVCIGTIEDRIDCMLTEKTALADRIVGSGDEWLTGLSTEELRHYLTLSPDAVGEE